MLSDKYAIILLLNDKLVFLKNYYIKMHAKTFICISGKIYITKLFLKTKSVY